MGEPIYSQALFENFRHLLPEMVLCLAACVLFLGGTFRANRHIWGWFALASFGLAIAALAYVKGFTQPADIPLEVSVYGTPVVFDSLAQFTRLISYLGGIVLLLLAWNELPDKYAADHHACLLIAIAGAGLVGCSNDLVMLLVALEMISIPTYVMLYLPRNDEASQEAALKYFLLSVFSSAVTLFGFSYLYGITGSTNIPSILRTLNLQAEVPAISQVALIMVVAGLGARITAVPFHFYAPDVFQGAPTIGASLLAFLPKVAGFVALLKVLGFLLPAGVSPRDGIIGMAISNQTPMFLFFLAAFTMSVGNLLALLQDNVKRLLAYSSVAHAGYMLMALASAPYLRQSGVDAGPDGVQSLLYYLVAYGAMTIGAFAVLAYLDTPERPVETVDDLAGIAKSNPVVALGMALFLFSLIGMPLTAGFTGKFLIFFGTMSIPGEQASFYRMLAFIGAINAAIGGWYYLRLVAVMYLRSPLQEPQPRRNAAGLATLWICALLTIGLSVPPAANWLLSATKEAAGVPTADR